MKKVLSIVVLFIVFTLMNCSSSENNSSTNIPTDSFTENFGNVVNSDFIGQITDESSQPIEGVEVKVGAVTKYTDARGIFVIKDATVFEKFAYITAKKTGFINGSRTVVPNSGSTTVKIMMLSATVVATISSGTTSEVPLSNGAKVSFDGNFKTETGAAYSGPVKVMIHHLDPSDPTTADRMPGSLMAQNSSGAQRILETYGMLNVELQDASGNKLQVVNPTALEMPISASQLATAPATIPLWYFDETLGYWKEEGSATKVGNKYVGIVNHFSWWNFDLPFPMVSLGITVMFLNQAPIADVRVDLIRNSQVGSSTVAGYTNAAGQVSGFVPANETLTINIYSSNPTCSNQVVYTQQIGPFSSDTILPTIVVPTSTTNTTVVQGTLTNCENVNVTNGYVWLQTASQFLFTQVTDGSFNFSVLTCSAAATSFTLQGLDFETSKSTTEQTGTTNNQIVALGNIQACETNSITGALLDIDQNIYTYITIGQQIWMQQNLNVSSYSDGTPVPQVTDQTQWRNLTTGAWCYYNNSTSNGAIYGKMYNWYAVMGIYDAASLTNPALRKRLAPTGWHVPSYSEWTELTTYLGELDVAGGKMKQTGTTLWANPNRGATNESGFTGLPGGYIRNYGLADRVGFSGYWWSTTDYSINFTYGMSLDHLNNSAIIYGADRNGGYSVRCIKD